MKVITEINIYEIDGKATYVEHEDYPKLTVTVNQDDVRQIYLQSDNFKISVDELELASAIHNATKGKKP